MPESFLQHRLFERGYHWGPSVGLFQVCGRGFNTNRRTFRLTVPHIPRPFIFDFDRMKLQQSVSNQNPADIQIMILQNLLGWMTSAIAPSEYDVREQPHFTRVKFRSRQLRDVVIWFHQKTPEDPGSNELAFIGEDCRQCPGGFELWVAQPGFELRKELARIDLSRNTQMLAMSCPAQKMQSETELEFSLLDSQADRATALELHTSADLFQSADQIGKQLKNRGRKKNILQLLVRTNGRACGTVSLHVVDQRIQILEEKQGSEIPAPPQVLCIYDLFVSPEYRNQTIGSRILEFATDLAWKNGIAWCGLITRQERESFYLKNGLKTAFRVEKWEGPSGNATS